MPIISGSRPSTLPWSNAAPGSPVTRSLPARGLLGALRLYKARGFSALRRLVPLPAVVLGLHGRGGRAPRRGGRPGAGAAAARPVPALRRQRPRSRSRAAPLARARVAAAAPGAGTGSLIGVYGKTRHSRRRPVVRGALPVPGDVRAEAGAAAEAGADGAGRGARRRRRRARPPRRRARQRRPSRARRRLPRRRAGSGCRRPVAVVAVADTRGARRPDRDRRPFTPSSRTAARS